jgi:hypothetical protein
MLTTGLILGSFMYLSIIGIWFRLPLGLKAASLWSPLVTDGLITVLTFFLAGGMSLSLTSMLASFWCDFLVFVTSHFLHDYASEWVRAQYAAMPKKPKTVRPQKKVKP